MNYNFTANVEEKFDVIANGEQEWEAMLEKFYKPFHDTVEDTIENAERATGERILGKDPETGRTLLVRMSRYGPVAQIGTPEEVGEEEKPKYANLRTGMNMETVTFEEAIDLFQLPKTLGNYEDLEVIVAIGRFGPYVKWNEAFISIPRDEEPLEVTFERAVELIEEKKKMDAPVGTYKELPITKGKGRFGPFLKWNDMFINVPRRYDPETITMDEMFELIAKKEEKEANRYIHQWPDEKISVENARWGPIIKFKKKTVKIPKIDDKRVTPEQAAEYTIEDVKKIIEEQIPGAFKKKTRKKAAPKKKKPPKKD